MRLRASLGFANAVKDMDQAKVRRLLDPSAWSSGPGAKAR